MDLVRFERRQKACAFENFLEIAWDMSALLSNANLKNRDNDKILIPCKSNQCTTDVLVVPIETRAGSEGI